MLQRITALILLICLCITPVLAHPGRTDASGGHWDHSTGTYHYHHGHPAHSHADTDGDGKPNCPYSPNGIPSDSPNRKQAWWVYLAAPVLLLVFLRFGPRIVLSVICAIAGAFGWFFGLFKKDD